MLRAAKSKRSSSSSGRKKGEPPKAKVTRHRKPPHMTLEEWQIALRREYGRAQAFSIKNVGTHPVFSEFSVANPATGKTYRVAIRGKDLGENFCSCPDYSTNTLGTCKHVEAVLARLEKSKGGKRSLTEGYRPPYSEIFIRYGARREVLFRAGSECPKEVSKAALGYFDSMGKLRPESHRRIDLFLSEAHETAPEHELRCYDDVLSYLAQVRDAEYLNEVLDKAYPQGSASKQLDGIVKAHLYPYQRTGALFAARAGRCLLADDMGLGKTVQAIAAAEILARNVGIQRVLIISPTSLKHQWCQEIGKFTDRTVLATEGSLMERTMRYAEETFFKVTNYDVLYRDLGLIRKWEPDLVILDEAQRIKNWATRAAKAVKSISSPYAIVLTGTPIENRLEELHSIIEFVDRFRLGPLFLFLNRHQQTDSNGRVIGYQDLGAISETLKPILLRRKKEEVLKELPERIDKTFFIPLTPQQRDHHEENGEIVARIAAKWRRFGFLSEADQRRLLIALQNMRMVCDSTYLLDPTSDYGDKMDELIACLSEMLEKQEEKAVVFSQWLRTHELIVDRVSKRNWDHVLFHGGVPSKERKGLIERFKNDPKCRLFLSTDAGGVGLNLQNASVVVNVDQPWNPAVLEQRIGRVHRLGQRKPVRVIHLVAQGSSEQGMLNVLAFKKSLFAGVLDGGQETVSLGGTKLKRFMDSVEQVTGHIPEPMLSDPESSAHGPEEAIIPELVDEDSMAGSSGAGIPPGWSEVFSVGAEMLNQFRRVFMGEGKEGDGQKAAGIAQKFLARDSITGEPHIRIPMPDTNTLQMIGGFLSALGQAISKRE